MVYPQVRQSGCLKRPALRRMPQLEAREFIHVYFTNQKKMKASTIQPAHLLVSSHSDLLDTSELWIIIRILNIKMKIIFNFEQRKHDHEHSHTIQE